MLGMVEKNKIYPINKNLAFIALEAPDSKKIIFNVIEYPVSQHMEENTYTVITNSEVREDCLIKAIKYLDIYYQQTNKMYDLIEELYNIVALQSEEKEEREAQWDHVEIDKKFCIKEMGISKEQIEMDGTWKWNFVCLDDGKWRLGAQ